ncbi:hypothetical protein O9K51_01084 [Purpureocillium lavendulum]|uniref:Uncharacterized protein n=1 Tax=Purpureocillium lavendulum TaxID=1247861 RepID=A0AB34G6E2_9HYPO|nr:hypothetical protein O9K51_01084 [Purpureocillium lavendulum]
MPDSPAKAAECTTTLSDIKKSFLNNKFRQCSDRCYDALKSAQDLENTQPAYLVYMHFFAAMALEMQARATPRSSSLRYSMFQKAQEHYRLGADIAKHTSETIVMPSKRNMSPSPSDQSISTDDSRSSTPTRMSSPAPSASSVADALNRSGPASRPKKRVAFRDVPVMEPIIRPDSPTLGFDDWLGRSSPEPMYPESILKHGRKTSDQTEMLPPPATPELMHEEESACLPFHESFSPHYCAILASINGQIQTHMAMLDEELVSCQRETSVPQNMDIRTRIERLRATGWRRRRFDATRYQNLCENVLADLI